MADSRKSYTIDLSGIPHTMLLTPEDAAAYGERAVLAKSAAQLKKEADAKAEAAQVEAEAKAKADAEAAEKASADAKAASTPANKAATAQNK